MKYKILIIVLLLTAVTGHAQHSGVISQYMFNTLIINPGYTGAKEVLTLNMNTRLQWVGIKGAPRTELVSGHTPLKKNKKVAIGGMLSFDQIGARSNIQLSGSFAYRLPLTVGKLSLGLSGGIANTSMGYVKTAVEDDPIFINENRNVLRPVFATGAFYYNKRWYAGYSTPSILTYYYSENGDKIKPDFEFAEIEHLIMGGYDFKVNRKLNVKPSTLMRFSPSNGFQMDINCNVIFDDTYWLGLSYRTEDAIVAMAEYNVTYKIKLGYAYDFSITDKALYTGGSHELMIEYGLGMFIKGKSPRHF